MSALCIAVAVAAAMVGACLGFLAAALLASEPAASNEITTPRATKSAAVASQSGRRFKAATAL